MKRLFFFLTLCFLSLLIGEGIYFFRKGFSPRRLQFFDLKKEVSLDKEAEKILSQPFYFLGRGRQCFAFESEDGKYVLKCPRTDIYKLPFWVRAFPFETHEKHLREDKTKRQKFVFESFRIACEELQEETGTIATHLGTSPPSKTKLTLVDALGGSHHFPLHTTLFVLQHKRDLWSPAFLKAKKNRDTAEQERLLHAFVDIVIERAKKGVLNRDRSFLRNYGFDGKKAYQIDVGDFFHIPNMTREDVFQKSVRDSLDPVQEWLAKIDPQMLEVLNRRIENLALN